MKNRTSQIIYAYWNEARHGRLAPRRFDIEPARIAGILAETLILEQAEDGAVRFRLAGTRIVEQLGMELRGRSFLDLWQAEDSATLAEHLETLQSRGGALRLEVVATSAEERSATFEAVLLPLIHTRDIVDRFLGAISCSHPPLWLGREPVVSLALAASEIIWPDGRPHAIASAMGQPPALHPATSGGRVVRFERRQFRVLDGGRNATKS